MRVDVELLQNVIKILHCYNKITEAFSRHLRITESFCYHHMVSGDLSISISSFGFLYKKLKPCLVKPIITETLSGYLRITQALSLCLVTSRLSNPCLVIPQPLRGLLSYPSIIRTLSSYLQITNPRMVTSGLIKSPSSCLRILQACLFTWGLLKIKTLSLVTSGPPKPCLFLRGH